MSYRKLWVLINRLPQDSWTQTALRDSAPDDALIAPDQGEHKFGPWGLTNYQMAQLTDAVHWLRWAVLTVNGGQPAPPDPTPTPAAKRRVRKQSDAAISYLNKLRAKGR